MNTLAAVLAIIDGLVLITVGVLESFYFRDRRLYRIFLGEPGDQDAVRMWSFNLGFYNMVWGLGIITGVLIASFGDATVGHTLVIYTCIAQAILGVVLYVSERRLLTSALAQSVPPLIILAVLAVTRPL